MKRFGNTCALLGLLTLGGVAGCASELPRRNIAGIVDDTSITAGVKAALSKDPQLKASDIDVETVRGVVQLSGFVSSAESVAAAATVARTVRGVRSIKNDLRLK